MKTPSTRARKRTGPRKLSSELTAAIAAALDKKAEDILVLDLTKASAFTDFFVICTGGNRRQIQAIGDAIVEAVGARGAKPALVEGYERGEWVLIDYFDFIVHIFQPATREFYSLERLWADAERVAVKAPPAPAKA
jgi:ribosome-associated protein